MKHNNLKDYYTKGFQDGRIFGIALTVVITMSIVLVVLTMYITLQ